MGVCCTQGTRGENFDKNEKSFHSNSNILAPVEERSGKREEVNGSNSETSDEVKFKLGTQRITSQSKNESVNLNCNTFQLVEERFGQYVYKELPKDDIKRVLKEPQDLENGAVYYGFW